MSAVEQLRQLHRAAVVEHDWFDQPGVGLASDGSWPDWESECAGRELAAVRDTYALVLGVLGVEPIVGEQP